MSFISLPRDIIRYILNFLKPKDCLCLALISKQYLYLLNSTFWINSAKTEFKCSTYMFHKLSKNTQNFYNTYRILSEHELNKCQYTGKRGYNKNIICGRKCIYDRQLCVHCRKKGNSNWQQTRFRDILATPIAQGIFLLNDFNLVVQLINRKVILVIGSANKDLPLLFQATKECMDDRPKRLKYEVKNGIVLI